MYEIQVQETNEKIKSNKQNYLKMKNKAQKKVKLENSLDIIKEENEDEKEEEIPSKYELMAEMRKKVNLG